VIADYVKYASNLHKNGMPIILEQEHFANLVGYDYSYLLGISNVTESYYKEYYLKKRDGGIRIINEPLPDLKAVQDWILDNLLMRACRPSYISRIAKAFIPKKNIKDNAVYHLNKKILVCLDLHDFFGSIKRNKIFSVFEKFGYSKSLCVFLSHLCTLDNILPQGAPTSPMLSNLIFKDCDDLILDYCEKCNITYTRYADDMIFSANEMNVRKLIGYVRNVIQKQGLKLNDKKTKVLYRGRRQTVTGIVVNDKLQATKKYRQKVRQEVYYIRKFGLENHISRAHISMSPVLYLRHLLGKVLFILFINEDDIAAIEYKRYLNYLLDNFNDSQS
jgi:RNA-directed DNA polymerase